MTWKRKTRVFVPCGSAFASRFVFNSCSATGRTTETLGSDSAPGPFRLFPENSRKKPRSSKGSHQFGISIPSPEGGLAIHGHLSGGGKGRPLYVKEERPFRKTRPILLAVLAPSAGPSRSCLLPFLSDRTLSPPPPPPGDLESLAKESKLPCP